MVIKQFKHSSFQITCTQVLYNSELKFSERLYSLLSPDIMKVKLFEPLISLVKHPSLYVRGSVSREAYDGLICLSDLRAAQLLLSCSRNNSFPTGNMVNGKFIFRACSNFILFKMNITPFCL